MATWTDLPTILAAADGRAAFYGYLRSMDAGDPSPRRLHRYLELLDEVALFRDQADDTQRRADHILSAYVGSDHPLNGLAGAAPSEKAVRELHLHEAGGLFRDLEGAVHEQLSPMVVQFLRDVERGDRSVRQRVKESGYLEFVDRLHGPKKRGKCSGNSCSLC